MITVDSSNPILWLIGTVFNLFILVLIVQAVLSWLVAFDVVNTRNQFVRTLGNFLYRVTEPVLSPIRARLPSLGGIDVSPIIAWLGLIFIYLVIEWLFKRLPGF